MHVDVYIHVIQPAYIYIYICTYMYSATCVLSASTHLHFTHSLHPLRYADSPPGLISHPPYGWSLDHLAVAGVALRHHHHDAAIEAQALQGRKALGRP